MRGGTNIPHTRMPKLFSNPARYGTVFLLLLATFCTAENKKSHAAREDHHEEKKTIQRMEDTWRTALLAGNPAPLEPMIADDFLGIGANGTVSNKAQYLENIHAGRFTLKKLDVESSDIRLLRDVAIVTSAVRLDATLNGSPYRGLFRYTRVYRLIGGGWKVINFEATRVSGSGSGSSEDMQRGKPLPRRSVQK